MCTASERKFERERQEVLSLINYIPGRPRHPIY